MPLACVVAKYQDLLKLNKFSFKNYFAHVYVFFLKKSIFFSIKCEKIIKQK